MKRLSVLFVLAFVGQACTPAGSEREMLTKEGHFYVIYSPEPDPIPLNELFDMFVMVHDGADKTTMLDEAVLVVDASMPEHGHGMNTVPVVTADGSGGFDVEGMKFHMPGKWQLSFVVTESGMTDSADFVIEME